jgi:hypothetical protein
MDENSLPRRLMYMQQERPRNVGRPRARWSDKDARNKDWVGNSHELQRIEETSEKGQVYLCAVATTTTTKTTTTTTMMMMMMMMNIASYYYSNKFNGVSHWYSNQLNAVSLTFHST